MTTEGFHPYCCHRPHSDKHKKVSDRDFECVNIMWATERLMLVCNCVVCIPNLFRLRDVMKPVCGDY